ncbi:MAG TPA: NAD(P)/FAD-dependent oxidoreductase, partial [Bacteroidia bacterium]|nr:NAD(P)/FAD-dependent oxidoreductase [Bacteroidia bacterium]
THTGKSIRTATLVWAAGVVGVPVRGFPAEAVQKNGRVSVDAFNLVKGMDNEYAIGDVSYMTADPDYPKGHQQVAQVAVQQAVQLGKNLSSGEKRSLWEPFRYNDKGSMATVGMRLAVVESKFINSQGLFAWFLWIFVHLIALVGFRNRVVVFFNWLTSYFSYDHGLRLIIRPSWRNKPNA